MWQDVPFARQQRPIIGVFRMCWLLPGSPPPPSSMRRGVLACRHRVLFWSAAGGAHWPIAIRRPSLGPFPSVGAGAHRPLATPVSLLFLLGLFFPLNFPFISRGLSLHRPWCPSASHAPGGGGGARLQPTHQQSIGGGAGEAGCAGGGGGLVWCGVPWSIGTTALHGRRGPVKAGGYRAVHPATSAEGVGMSHDVRSRRRTRQQSSTIDCRLAAL